MQLTGVAWLSSARVVRCLVKSFNERNPFEVLVVNICTSEQITNLEFVICSDVHLFNHSLHTAGYILEEGKDYVKSSWPLWAGLHTCYNGGHKGKQWCESERILKNHLSSDCSLQFENMKMESLVIVDQHATVNLYLSLVLTARHALEVEWIGSILCFTIKFVIFAFF